MLRPEYTEDIFKKFKISRGKTNAQAKCEKIHLSGIISSMALLVLPLENSSPIYCAALMHNKEVHLTVRKYV